VVARGRLFFTHSLLITETDLRTHWIQLTANGVVTATVKLGDELPNLGHHPRCQLISVNGRIVLLAPGEPVADRHDRPATHSYVIDPKTGSIEYSTKVEPQ
jgi:hypothetical protein